MPKQINSTSVTEYWDQGYAIVRSFLNNEETNALQSIALSDDVIRQNALDLNDQSNKKTKLTLWFTPGDDIYGRIARSKSVVQSIAQLMDNESPVCHFHTKLMQKEPKVGGAWEWHQDYGYWYKNQFLYPDQLTSMMIAITEANKENGCLQVIKGSHKMGRVNHGFAGEQVGADMAMVDLALKTMDLEYVELMPGDALFFHPNLIHRSDANRSDTARWSIISCYNSKSNPAYNDESEGWRKPIDVINDSEILKGRAAVKSDFLQKENDPALKETGWE